MPKPLHASGDAGRPACVRGIRLPALAAADVAASTPVPAVGRSSQSGGVSECQPRLAEEDPVRAEAAFVDPAVAGVVDRQ